MQYLFSIHTFEIVCDMSKSVFMELMDAFFDFREKMKGEAIPIFSEKVKGYRFTCLKKQGINQVSFKMIGDGEFVYKWRVSFKVNPRQLLGMQGHPFIHIVPPEHLEEIPELLDSIIQEICPGFLSIFHCGKIVRIDYCTNILMKSKSRAKKYLNILRQGYFPSYLTPDMAYDKIKKKKMFKHGRMTLKSTYYTFEAYLKNEQMKQSRYKYDEDEMKEAESQIRFEFRAKYRKILELKKKYNIDTEAEFLWTSPQIAEIEFNRILKGIYGSGDFYNTEEAKKRIWDSSYKEPVKLQMIMIIQKTKEQKSLTNVLKMLDLQCHERRKYFNYFNELGISPITFGKPGCHYKNPLTYIKENNVNYD